MAWRYKCLGSSVAPAPSLPSGREGDRSSRTWEDAASPGRPDQSRGSPVRPGAPVGSIYQLQLPVGLTWGLQSWPGRAPPLTNEIRVSGWGWAERVLLTNRPFSFWDDYRL